MEVARPPLSLKLGGSAAIRSRVIRGSSRSAYTVLRQWLKARAVACPNAGS